MKRAIAVILMVMFVLSLSIPSAAFSKTTVKVIKKAPVTLKIYGAQGFPGQFPNGVQTDEISKEITRITGVTLDWDMQPSADKTKAMIASGDIPDIFIPSDTTFLDSLVSSSAVRPLDSLLKTNGQNVLNLVGKGLDYSKRYISSNTGKVYFIPGRVSGKDTFLSPVIGLFMRWDYYKEIGSPVLKNYDDVMNAVEKILKNHPTTADGQKVFGFSPWFDWGIWSSIVFPNVMFAKGGVTGYTNGGNFDFVDRIGSDNSDLWLGATFTNKAYRKGLLDPDSFTQKYDAATAKMDAGRVVCQLAQWTIGNVNAELAKTGKKDAGYVNIPMTGEKLGMTYNPVGLASYWSISSTCKKPDRAMDVINYFFSEEGTRTLVSGVKGKYWVEDKGKAKLTALGLKAKNDPNFMAKTGIHKFQNFTGIDSVGKDSRGQYVDLFLEPDMQAKTLSPVTKDWLKTYGAPSEDELWKKIGAYANNTAFNALLPRASDDDLRINSKIDTYLLTNMPRVWMAKTDAEYNAVKASIRAEIQKMDGYAQMLKNKKKAIDFTRGIYNDFN